MQDLGPTLAQHLTSLRYRKKFCRRKDENDCSLILPEHDRAFAKIIWFLKFEGNDSKNNLLF